MPHPSSLIHPVDASIGSLETVARTIPLTMTSQGFNPRMNQLSAPVQGVTTSLRQVPFTLDLKSWMADNTTRYFLPQLIIASSSWLDKKIAIEQHVSDAVVWNLVYIDTLTDFPTESPTPEMKSQALLFLIEFRRQLNAMFVEEIRQLYLNAANSQGWMELKKSGDNFVSYKDLVQRTVDETDEMVRS